MLLQLYDSIVVNANLQISCLNLHTSETASVLHPPPGKDNIVFPFFIYSWHVTSRPMSDILSAALTQMHWFVDLNLIIIVYFSTRSIHRPAYVMSCQVIEHKNSRDGCSCLAWAGNGTLKNRKGS